MFQNNLKIALRTILRHKVYSFINIISLTIGLTCFLLISLYVKDELNYDSFHKDGDRIFRVLNDHQRDGESPATSPVEAGSNTSAPLANALLKDVPGIESVVRLRIQDVYIKQENKGFKESKFVFADTSFFSMFSFPLQYGNAKSALSEPFKIVLSQTAAKKHFGDKNPLGAILTIEDSLNFVVSGVMAPLPANSHLDIDFITSLGTFLKLGKDLNNWWFDKYITYVKLAPSADQARIAKEVYGISRKYIGEEEKASGMWKQHFLEPFQEIYLQSTASNPLGRVGNAKYVYIFSVVAVFVLLIACINFINLSTAQASKRAKEVGMRKVLGAFRSQLIKQFLAETLLFAFLAAGLSMMGIFFLLPWFNQISLKSLTLSQILEPATLGYLVGITLLAGFIAGIYPAFVLSGFRPINVLKGTFKLNTGDNLLRKGLVVTQFSIAIVLIIGTVSVHNQLQYMQNKKLGFSKEQIIVVSGEGISEFQKQSQIFNQEVAQLPHIAQTTLSSTIPGHQLNSIAIRPEGLEGEQMSNMLTAVVDDKFMATYDIKLLAGRFFSSLHATDPQEAFVLNQSAVEKLGWQKAENAIGKSFEWGLGKKGRVIGVVADFHHLSLHEKVPPIVMHIQPDWFKFSSIKVQTSDLKNTLATIESTWQKVFPNRPFEYFFLDEYYGRQYQAEDRLGTVMNVFAVITIVVACLGLFGLAAFVAGQRTKEIGIRKVLGATVTNIMFMLSKDFTKLVAISIVIACPVAWLAIGKWQEDFAYRADISLWIFIISGTVALLIALFTISCQAIKAAVANPVDSLRNE